MTTDPIEIALLPSIATAKLTDYAVVQRRAGSPLQKATIAQLINTVGEGSTIVAGDVTITSGDAVLDTATVTVLQGNTLTFNTGSGTLSALTVTGTLAAGVLSAPSAAIGSVTGTSVAMTGTVSGAVVSGTTVNGGTVAASGALTGATGTITGLINAGTITTAGTVTASAGAISTLTGTTATLTGNLTGGTLTTAGTATAAVVTAPIVNAGSQTLRESAGPSQHQWLMVNENDEAAVGYADGEFTFPDIRAQNITVLGGFDAPNAARQPGIPEHCHDVTTSGAVDDADDGWHSFTWAESSATLSAVTFYGAVTIAAGGTSLTIGFTHDGGVSFQPGIDEGKTIAITGAGAAGATLVTTISRVTADGVAILTDPAVTALSASTQSVMWPCFSAASVGKAVWMDATGFRTYWVGSATYTDSTDTVPTKPFMAFVSAYVSPFSVTLDRNLPGTATGKIRRIVIGNNNAQAVVDAGNAAIASGKSALWFPGRGLYFLPAILAGSAEDPRQDDFGEPDSTIGESNTMTAALKDLPWLTGAARVFCVDAGGRQTYHRAIPMTAPSPRLPTRGVYGSKTLRAMTAEDTPVIVKTGDSIGTTDPSNQNSQTEAASFDAWLLRCNAYKSITILYRSMGGGTLAELACATNTRGGGIGSIYPWHNGSTSWMAQILALSPVPDVIDIPHHGINEETGFHPIHLFSVRTRFKALVTRESNSPDLIWHTSPGKAMALGIPALAQGMESQEDVAGWYRGLGALYGDGVVDFLATSMPAQWGFDDRARATRRIPNYSHAISPTLPLTMPGRARAWKMRARLIGASGSNVWTNAGMLRVILSARPDNYLELAVNSSGFLTYRVQSWGRAVSTTTSITNGATTLTTSGQSSYTTPLAWFIRRSHLSIGSAGSGPLVSGHNGKCLLFPGTDYGAQPQRTFIEKIITDNTARVDDFGPVKQNSYSATSTAYIGGMMFVEHDAHAKTDIIITDGSGNIHKTKIVGFTSRNQVALQNAWPYSTLSSATATIWVGHTQIDTTTTAINARDDAGADPFFIFAINGGHLQCRYATGSQIDDVNDRPVEVPGVVNQYIMRGHGPYIPRIECTGAGLTVNVSNAWMDWDDPILYQTVKTQRVLRGSPDNYAYGGEATHAAGPFFATVWQPTIEAQDFAT